MKYLDYINTIAAKTGVPAKEVRRIIDESMEVIKKTLEENDIVRIAGFGTFYPSVRKERTCKVPVTNETVIVPRKKVVKFRPSKKLQLTLGELDG